MKTARTQVRRKPARGSYELAEAQAILREALFGHLAFVEDGRPLAIPMAHALVETTIYLHGSSASRACRVAGSGVPLCFTATVVDGVVVVKSMANSSLNYRSCVVLGRGRSVDDPGEVHEAYRAVVEHLIPGRTADARPPTSKELRKTAFVALPLEEFSVKMRRGGPVEEAEDVDLGVWSGVVPARLSFATALPAADAGAHPPAYLAPYRRPAEVVRS